MKGGTTSAATFLGEHPEAFVPKMKETHHFSTDLRNHRHALMRRTVHNFRNLEHVFDPDAFEAIFADAKPTQRYRVDASTSHLYSTEAAANIARYRPDARIVILLRDPVMRAWSEFRMNRMIGVEAGEFDKALRREAAELAAGRTFLFKRYILAGLYADQVQRYLDVFPQEQVFIDVMDTPGEGMEGSIRRLCDFLGIDPAAGGAVSQENQAREPSNFVLNGLLYASGLKAFISQYSPESLKAAAKQSYYHLDTSAPSAESRNAAAAYFRDSNARLQALTGLDLSHWTRG